MNEAHFHWMFQACNAGQTDPVEMTVIGHMREDSARASVEELVVRDSYRLIKVWQCNTCAFQSKMAEAVKLMTS
jgi:hypothetical protein